VHGVSTRKVDELVKALGMGGISKSRVSELCEELDGEVERFRNRPLEGSYPGLFMKTPSALRRVPATDADRDARTPDADAPW
jgi:hypothetical protein